MTCFSRKLSNMNVISSFLVAVFSGCVLTTVYVLLTHNLLHRHLHTSINIEVHLSNFSYMSKLLDKTQKSLPKQIVPESQKQIIIIDEKKNGKSQVKQPLKDIKRIRSYAYHQDLDLLKWKRPSFLQAYKNPCWLETKHTKTTCRHGAFYHVKFTEDLKPPILRCLPYFYMVGQPRSGLTNIYERLIRHPDIIAPHMKDIFWIQRHRFQLRCSSVNTYLDFFHETSEDIRMNATIDIKTNTSYYNKVTGDCSGDIMWDNTRWQDLPGNENCTEPCLTNADYIKHLNPSAKIIVALRDPIDRVYSDYLAQSVWLKYDPDNEMFNKLVIEQIFQLNKCLINNHTIRYCVYNRDIYHSDSQVRIGIGLYAIHLEDWYRVFPRKQIHVIQFEDFITNTENEMSRIFKFLNLQKIDSSEMKYIMEPVFKNARTRFAEGPDMWIETRKILSKFYEPYSILLSKLLHDKKYL